MTDQNVNTAQENENDSQNSILEEAWDLRHNLRLSWSQVEHNLFEMGVPNLEIKEIVAQLKDREDGVNREEEEIDQREMEQKFMENPIDNRGMFLRPFSFKGRIRRLEYFLSFIICFVAIIIMTILVEENPDEDWIGILALPYILLIIFNLAQSAKRAHDRNSPWGFIFIPYYCIFLLFAPGDKGINDYGNSPKDPKEKVYELEA